MKYALGKRSLGICDRCGFEFPYLRLKPEWDGVKVCPECWEEKHPQLGPFTVPSEPQALYKPRPQTALPMDVAVGQNNVFPPWHSGPLQAIVSVGTVEVTT